jgi:hypothetical protein
MAEWTELLPKGVVNPIVVEILHPLKNESPEVDPRLQADLERLRGDAAFNESKNKMLQQVGADLFSMLFIGTEYWRGKDQENTGGVRSTDPQGREVNIVVHLPPSAARTPQEEASATQLVLDWLAASELGKALRRVAQGRISNFSARGRRYDNIKSLGQIVKKEDVQLAIGPPS